MEPQKYRSIIVYKGYFEDFLVRQKQKVKDKIYWTFKKKTQKTPDQEMAKAIKIKKEYYEEKKQHKKP